MAAFASVEDDFKKKVFDCISNNNIAELRVLLKNFQGDFVDEHGMTPLQHASYKGNKEIVRLLLDQGANVNSTHHEHNYSALHFATLSGNAEVCHMLMSAGANTHAVNSVGKIPSQLASFVGMKAPLKTIGVTVRETPMLGVVASSEHTSKPFLANHQCVATINNFIPPEEIALFTVPRGGETEAKLPAALADPAHKFATQINMNPVRIALNLQPALINFLEPLRYMLTALCEREMKYKDMNEVMAFRLHFLAAIVADVAKYRQSGDPVEAFVKKVLHSSRGSEYVDGIVRECVREFPYRDSYIFRQLVKTLSRGRPNDGINTIKRLVYPRVFPDDDTDCVCSTCGELKKCAMKKCAKCKNTQYCDRNCQRLHWFVHKKECDRISTAVSTTTKENYVKQK